MDHTELSEPLRHHGDLIVPGHLGVAAPLVVTGSLTVDGCLYDHGSEGRIVVGGDLTAHAVFSAGDLLVQGDIRADVVHCVSLDPRTTASGTVRARLVLEEDPSGAPVEADVHLDYDGYLAGRPDGQEGLRERLQALHGGRGLRRRRWERRGTPGPARTLRPAAGGEPVFHC